MPTIPHAIFAILYFTYFQHNVENHEEKIKSLHSALSLES